MIAKPGFLVIAELTIIGSSLALYAFAMGAAIASLVGAS